MTDTVSPNIAIVGSGPSGCYLAQSLLRTLPGSDITVFDRSPVPFGLIRYGVAADHQHTKSITRQFDRVFADPRVRFAGNIDVGTDIPLDELRTLFDIVVLATGLWHDAPLALPGAGLPGVHGSGAVIRSLNTHPDADPELPQLSGNVVIVGAGNVALDVLRFLVKDETGYAGSDIAAPALAAYLNAPATHVTVLSRSPLRRSKGDPQMIRELAALPRATYALAGDAATDGTALERDEAALLDAFASLIAPTRPAYPGPRVTFHFGVTPVRILGERRATGIECRSGEELIDYPADSIVTAIGFTTARVSSATASDPSESGRIAPGLYRTGWAKRGPRGAIPENRVCAKSVAEEIAADLRIGALDITGHRRGYGDLDEPIRSRAVDYAGWQRIDAHEQSVAKPGRVRDKLSTHREMLRIAQQHESTSTRQNPELRHTEKEHA